MNIFHPKPKRFPKIAVLASGLAAAALMVVTINPAPAQAFTITAAATATTTALAVTPATPVVASGGPTLTATVTTGAAGAVEFFNGTTSLGAKVPVSSTGVATQKLCGIASGSYSYKAVFTPTDAAAFDASTSSAVAFVVTAPLSTAGLTTTKLVVSPAAAVVPGSPTLTATVTTGAAGTVEFCNGTTSLGAPITVLAGVAKQMLTSVIAGNYSYTAVFTPTDAAALASSTSVAVPYVVTAPGIVPGTPTDVKATAGDRLAHVTWTLPKGAGTSLITKYTVTASPGGKTATMTGDAKGLIPNSVDVTGLTNGTSYTFSVTATSTAGSSLPSAASTAVTPVVAKAASLGSALSNTSPVATTPSPKGSSSRTTPSPLAAALREVVAPGSSTVVPKGAPNTGAGGASHLR